MAISAIDLYKKYTKEQLLSMDKAVSENPENKNLNGGIYIHTPSARKQLAEIGQAIAWHMADEREAKGEPVPVEGYSGRGSKRK